MWWSLPWITLLGILLIIATWTTLSIPYGMYENGRAIGLGIMIVLAVAGLLRAFDMIGTAGEPWYTISFLVALVMFWGLFPPTWFFTEYLLFDRETIQFPEDVRQAIERAELEKDLRRVAEIKKEFLGVKKTYADMGSRIWVAVGAALGTTIGFAKR